MIYPLLIGGEQTGSAEIRKDGLYTVIEAQSDTGEELTRIWLHGGGERSYLGIMQKCGAGLYFSKRYTRRDMAAFPAFPEYVSDSDEIKIKSEQRSEEPPGKDRLWYRNPDGSLVSFDGEERLLALPCKLRGSSRTVPVLSIEGREYMIFRY